VSETSDCVKCTKESPWKPRAGEHVVHVDAVYAGVSLNGVDDYCDLWRCPNCGVMWREEFAL